MHAQFRYDPGLGIRNHFRSLGHEAPYGACSRCMPARACAQTCA